MEKSENKNSDFDIDVHDIPHIIFGILLILSVFSMIAGSLYYAYSEDKISQQQVMFLSEEIPDVIKITKDDIKDVVYVNEDNKNSYTVMSKDKTYRIFISKEKKEDASFDYDMQVSSINEERLNGK